MADELTITGLSIDDYETRRAAVVAALRAEISAILDVSPEQPTGQLTDILLERVQAVAELLQSIHSAIDPGQATGTLTVNLDALTTLPAGSIAAVTGDLDNQWVTDVDCTSVGAGNYTVLARASETGPIQALAGTITVIVTPVAGWNSVTNAAAATMGEAEETDAELRLRRELETTLGGSSSVDAIRAALVNLDGMIMCQVLERETWAAGNGMPPHSIEALIWDGAAPVVANADIAEQIFLEKPAGIQAYGSTVVTHADSSGIDHLIGFTRATQVAYEMTYNLLVDPDEYTGSTALAAAIAAWSDANLMIGGVYGYMVYSRYFSLPFQLAAGVLNVDGFNWSVVGNPNVVTDLPVGIREIPTVAAVNITINLV